MWQGLISILMFHISDVWQNIIKIAGSLFTKVYSVVPLPSCWPWLFLYWNGPKLQYGWWEVSLFIEFRITILEFLSLGYKKKNDGVAVQNHHYRKEVRCVSFLWLLKKSSQLYTNLLSQFWRSETWQSSDTGLRGGCRGEATPLPFLASWGASSWPAAPPPSSKPVTSNLSVLSPHSQFSFWLTVLLPPPSTLKDSGDYTGPTQIFLEKS